MTPRIIALSALVFSIALPATAGTFIAENRTKVTALSNNTFQVKPETHFGVPGQWCGAADYARRVLGAGWSDRIYVRGKSGRNVQFGLTPGGATPSSISIVSASANTPGANFSVQRAFGYCIDQRVSPFNDR